LIKKVWFWISNQGVEDHLADENALTILLNRMGAVSLVSLSSFSVFLYYSDIYLIFPIITFLISILYGNTIVLNSFGKIYWARINCSTGTLLWVCIYYICFHGFFSQSLSVGATIIVNFVAFAKRPRLMISLNVFHIVLYIAAISYSIVNPPLLQLMDYPLAAIMGFLVSLGWMSTVLFIFYNQNEKLIFQLKAKNKELQSTTDELERFNYIASHDLKTPLRTVNSFIGLIERDIKKGKFDNLEDRLNFVKSGAQQMNFIIEDILELSLVKRLDKSKRKRLHLNTILEQAKMNLATDIAEKRAFIVAKDLHHFHGNEVEFILLFQNLIQNGIKYNNSKTPTISISCSQNEEPCVIGSLKITMEPSPFNPKKERDQSFPLNCH